MSYVLDGIKTAMVARDGADGELGYVPARWECPCGWGSAYSIFGSAPESNHQILAALRFHYTHCPQARTPEPESET